MCDESLMIVLIVGSCYDDDPKSGKGEFNKVKRGNKVRRGSIYHTEMDFLRKFLIRKEEYQT